MFKGKKLLSLNAKLKNKPVNEENQLPTVPLKLFHKPEHQLKRSLDYVAYNHQPHAVKTPNSQLNHLRFEVIKKCVNLVDRSQTHKIQEIVNMYSELLQLEHKEKRYSTLDQLDSMSELQHVNL